ncbi:MAG: tetratricopeptide repeat protein [Bacteriovoracia bacterium]
MRIYKIVESSGPKLKVFIGLGCILSILGAKAPPPNLQKTLKEAKELLLSAKRREAIAKLESIRPRIKSKQQAKQIVEQRKLFLEQFLSSESFQSYASAKNLYEAELWQECLRILEQVMLIDQDNILVMRLRAQCSFGLQKTAETENLWRKVLEIEPNDPAALVGLAQVKLEKKDPQQGLSILSDLDPKIETETVVILKSKFLRQLNQKQQATDLLKESFDSHPEQLAVLYELSQLYLEDLTDPKGEWMARKHLSLFLSRCSKLHLDEPQKSKKGVKLQEMYKKAQAQYQELEKKPISDASL